MHFSIARGNKVLSTILFFIDAMALQVNSNL